MGAKLFGVVSLDAIARTALEHAAGPILVTADARRSEVYWAVYSGLSANGAPIMIEGPGVCKPAELEAKFSGKSLARTDAKISAAALGRVFDAQLIDGTATHDVTALYLREADAVAPKDLREAGKKVSG